MAYRGLSQGIGHGFLLMGDLGEGHVIETLQQGAYLVNIARHLLFLSIILAFELPHHELGITANWKTSHPSPLAMGTLPPGLVFHFIVRDVGGGLAHR